MSSGSLKPLSAVGRRHALLASRARQLARPRNADVAVKTIQTLVCEAGDELYALPLLKVAKVAPVARLANVPASNPALVGVTARAGVFYHVYDLAALVGGRSAVEGHLVMLRGTPALALRVGAAMRVAELLPLDAAEAASLRAAHPSVTGFARADRENFFDGRIISLIDPDKLAPSHALGRVQGDQA